MPVHSRQMKLLPVIAVPMAMTGVLTSPAVGGSQSFVAGRSTAALAGPVATIRFLEVGLPARATTTMSARMQLNVTATCTNGGNVTASSTSSGSRSSARMFVAAATGQVSGTWRVQLPQVRVQVGGSSCVETTIRALVVVLRDRRTGATITLNARARG